MQLFIPPLEETAPQEDTSSDNGMAQDPNNISNSNQDENSGRGVLPQELRENFEAMKSVWRQSRRATNSGEESEELKHKERVTAEETAIAVDTEISRWQSGIAELEALLLVAEQEDQEDEEQDDNIYDEDHEQPAVRQHAVRFPSLPPVVPLEDDESLATDQSDESGPGPAATTGPWESLPNNCEGSLTFSCVSNLLAPPKKRGILHLATRISIICTLVNNFEPTTAVQESIIQLKIGTYCKRWIREEVMMTDGLYR